MSPMISPIVTISQEMVEKKRIKTIIGVGSVVKAKVGDMEENIREGRTRRIRKEMVGYLQSMVGNNRFLFQFKDGKNK